MSESNQTLLIPCKSDEKCKFPSVNGWFQIDNKPLRIDTVLFIGSFDEFKKQLKKRKNMDLSDFESDDAKMNDGITFPFTDCESGAFIAIWMNEFDWSLDDMETLIHECIHATIMVMRASGVRAKIFDARTEDEVDDEQLAYICSSMYSNFIEKLIRKQNRTLKKIIHR